jgi:acetyltransferase-like isoleucine patch superfamily enzyme
VRAVLSPRDRRRAAASVIHRVWRWAERNGALTPDDRHGFRAFGAASMLAFPQGDIFGERWISIGTQTLFAPGVSLSVGMPTEVLDPSSPPVVVIGDRCFVGRGSSIVGRVGIAIEDDVTIAPNVYVTDHNHAYGDVEVPIGMQFPVSAPVRIGSGSWLGVGVTVLPGTTIGRHVAVAAGSVVRGEVPDHAVVAGSPAEVVRRWTAAGGWAPPLPPTDTVIPPDWPTRS